MKSSRGNPQIYHYLKKYQSDPKSRVFAPLAEAYRKAGLFDEAIEICRDGIRHHPNFIGGRVALGRALFDKGDYETTVKELSPVVIEAPDNLVAQKLLAESCLILGRLAESLAAYKVLLFFMPKDEEIARLVQELESRAYEDGLLVLQDDPVPLKSFSVQSADRAISGDPSVKKQEWINRIELLQSLLLRVQRIKLANIS
ncbi:MAG: tetratricopeptide repeat protein [Bdellovibrionales bacterium]|nr:tetratricopeptide repeat protein [Bdellovibrionales bacterium]